MNNKKKNNLTETAQLFVLCSCVFTANFNHQLGATLVLQLWYKICELTSDPGNPTSPVFPDLPGSP